VTIARRQWVGAVVHSSGGATAMELRGARWPEGALVAMSAIAVPRTD
jgi:predicted dienelactone hydrolase